MHPNPSPHLSLYPFLLPIPHASSFFAYCSHQPPDSIPGAAPLSWGGFFPSTPSPMSLADSFLLRAAAAPQEESPEHRENGHPFPSSGTVWAAVLQSFWLQTPPPPRPQWVPVLTSCQSTSSLATRLFSPVFKEKYGYSESLKNPPSLSIVRSQQDCYQTKNARNLPLPFKSAKLCFVNNCSQLPNLRRMPFICIHVRVVILNGNQSLSGTSKALL